MIYADLVIAVKDTLETDEATFNAHIDEFIVRAEKSLYHKLMLPVSRKAASGNFAGGNKYLGTPPDFIAPYSLTVTVGGMQKPLLIKDTDFMREAFPDDTVTGTPKYYSLFDHNTLIVGPIPPTSLPAEFDYFYIPPSITTGVQTWLGDNAEKALFYQAVVEAYTFLKGDPDLLAGYKAQASDALQDLSNIGEIMTSHDTYRHGQKS